MGTITISLPDEEMKYVEKRMEETGYGSASEFIRGLIREDKFESEVGVTLEPELEATLLAALDEGEPIEMDEQYWMDFRTRAMARREARQKKANAKS